MFGMMLSEEDPINRSDSLSSQAAYSYRPHHPSNGFTIFSARHSSSPRATLSRHSSQSRNLTPTTGHPRQRRRPGPRRQRPLLRARDPRRHSSVPLPQAIRPRRQRSGTYRGCGLGLQRLFAGAAGARGHYDACEGRHFGELSDGDPSRVLEDDCEAC